ncbi:MAG: imelysin family protein, partial [Pseudomonadota bacterium]
MRFFACILSLTLAAPAVAQDMNVAAAVDQHIVPGFSALARASADLAQTAQTTCDATDPGLRAAYGKAFDALISVSHLRFGPTEAENRGFALAFWPDPRGSTPRTLATLIANEDAIADSVDKYRDVSVAARGFYALEFLLFDAQFLGVENKDYTCTLMQTVAADIARTSGDIFLDWSG